MDKFTENLTESLRRFALAGVGAVSLTIEKSKDIIDQLVSRGEATAAEGQAACEDLQKKMAAQLDMFTKKIKADYEKASFEDMLERCDDLTEEQKAILMERLTAQPEKATETAEAPIDIQENAETDLCKSENVCEAPKSVQDEAAKSPEPAKPAEDNSITL